jgi:hypothetical protein
MKKIFLAMLLFSALGTTNAKAADPFTMQCIEYDKGIDILNRHNAAIFARGITITGNMIEMYYNPETREWRLFAVVPDSKGDKFLCMVGGGPDIEFFNEPAGNPI